MRRMMTSEGGAIGLGAPTAIGLYTGPRLRYVGPVPTELQSYTQYGVVATPTATRLAHDFLDYLAGPEARALLQRAGVETQ